MKETNLNQTRRKVAYTLCEFTPMFILPLFIELKDMSWVRYIIGLVVFIILAGLYYAVFLRFVCPEDADTTAIKTSRKWLAYLSIFAVAILSFLVFDTIHANFIVSLLPAILTNFVLTMVICYYIAKK